MTTICSQLEIKKGSINMETQEFIKLKRRLDGLHGRLSDMMDDVNELQQDIQILY